MLAMKPKVDIQNARLFQRNEITLPRVWLLMPLATAKFSSSTCNDSILLVGRLIQGPYQFNSPLAPPGTHDPTSCYYASSA